MAARVELKISFDTISEYNEFCAGNGIQVETPAGMSAATDVEHDPVADGSVEAEPDPAPAAPASGKKRGRPAKAAAPAAEETPPAEPEPPVEAPSEPPVEAQAATLDQEVRERRRSAGTLTAAQQARVDQLGPLTGADPVTGPGIRLTVDDGPETVSGSRVVDTDLRMATNGLWAAGAEAVSINGYRLSARTAIRNAGGAITVDYRSLSRPYVLEAIGDLDTLGTAFPTTEGGRWLEGLKEHYGMQSTMERVRSLTLGADPGLDITHAREVR